MRVVDWQRANKPSGGDCGSARLRPGTAVATMTTASPAAERSFGIHQTYIHNFNERPWGPGDEPPG